MTTLYQQEVTEDLRNEYLRKWQEAQRRCGEIGRPCRKTGDYEPHVKAIEAVEEALFDYRMVGSLLTLQWEREEVPSGS